MCGEWGEIASAIAGLLAGIGLTVTYHRLKLGKRANQVTQSDIKAGGDVVGRDKISRP
jgi:hypothetical protein